MKMILDKPFWWNSDSSFSCLISHKFWHLWLSMSSNCSLQLLHFRWTSLICRRKDDSAKNSRSQSGHSKLLLAASTFVRLVSENLKNPNSVYYAQWSNIIIGRQYIMSHLFQMILVSANSLWDVGPSQIRFKTKVHFTWFVIWSKPQMITASEKFNFQSIFVFPFIFSPGKLNSTIKKIHFYKGLMKSQSTQLIY